MLSDEIIHYIDEQSPRLIEETVSFIRTISVSGSEGAIADSLITCLERSGQSAFRDEAGNVVASFGGIETPGPEEKILAFNVHLDTVPSGSRDLWKHDPFGGIVAGDKIFGRGASDTKGAWAPMILAMEAVMKCGVRLGGKILFTAVVMEELGLCAGMKHLLENTLKDSLPHYMILGEPTGLNIAVGHKGKTELQITTHGRSCHASAPSQGKNALYAAAPVIASVERLAGELGVEPEGALFGRSTVALTDIVCNPGVRNVVPDRCAMYLDCRLLPRQTKDGIKERVSARLKRDSVEADVQISTENMRTYTGLEVSGDKFIPGFELDESHRLVRIASEAVSEALSRKPEVYRWDFATDGGWSMGKLGIPTIGFSPCEESLAHTVDEYVRISYMKDAAKAYAAMIISILGRA